MFQWAQDIPTNHRIIEIPANDAAQPSNNGENDAKPRSRADCNEKTRQSPVINVTHNVPDMEQGGFGRGRCRWQCQGRGDIVGASSPLPTLEGLEVTSRWLSLLACLSSTDHPQF